MGNKSLDFEMVLSDVRFIVSLLEVLLLAVLPNGVMVSGMI